MQNFRWQMRSVTKVSCILYLNRYQTRGAVALRYFLSKDCKKDRPNMQKKVFLSKTANKLKVVDWEPAGRIQAESSRKLWFEYRLNNINKGHFGFFFTAQELSCLCENQQKLKAMTIPRIESYQFIPWWKKSSQYSRRKEIFNYGILSHSWEACGQPLPIRTTP